jgi:ABC-type nitrate/sulfonate/bicarbonate transport system substrate-binding protein
MKRLVQSFTFILLVLTGLGLASPVIAQEVVKFGIQHSMDPLFIAIKLGSFNTIEKKHNVKFEWPLFHYGGAANQALGAREIQLSTAGMGPAIIASTRLPAKLIAITILDQTAILVRKDSPINSIRDLKGKKVVHPGKGTQQYPLLVKALADAGLTMDDILEYKSKGADLVTLLENGSVDVAIVWDPDASNSLAGGKTRVLIQASKIMPIKGGYYVGNGVYGLIDFIDSHRPLVQDIVNELARANDFILSNSEKAVDIWSEYMKLPKEPIRYSLKHGISVFSRDIVPEKETVERYVKFLKEAEILKPEEIAKFDESFARSAMKALFQKQ